MHTAQLVVTVRRESRYNQVPFVSKKNVTSPLGVRWMLAPNFSSVTLVFPQTCLPVPAPRRPARRSISPSTHSRPATLGLRCCSKVFWMGAIESGQSTLAVWRVALIQTSNVNHSRSSESRSGNQSFPLVTTVFSPVSFARSGVQGSHGVSRPRNQLSFGRRHDDNGDFWTWSRPSLPNLFPPSACRRDDTATRHGAGRPGSIDSLQSTVNHGH